MMGNNQNICVLTKNGKPRRINVKRIAKKRLRAIHSAKGLTIKIKAGVNPDIAARILRILANRIDRERLNE